MPRFTTVIVTAALISFPFQVAVADQIERMYVGVFASKRAEVRLAMPSTRTELLADAAQLLIDDYRLTELETYRAPGGLRHFGIWRKGQGSNIFAGPMSIISFREEREARIAEGMKLADFDMLRDPNLQYVGVWRGAPGPERITGRMEIDAFLARATNLAEQDNLRLVDLEVDVVNGIHLYQGLFRPGDGANKIVSLRPRSDFIAEVEQFRDEGLELVDVELLPTSGRPLYTGVLRPGQGRHTLAEPRGIHSFANLVMLQNQFGRELIDVEMFERVVPDPVIPDPSPDEVEPGPVTALPLPDWVEFTDQPRLVVDFSQHTEAGFRMVMPTRFLDDLPRFDGVIAIPDQMCGLKVRKAIRWDWSEDGEALTDDMLFNAMPKIPPDDPDTPEQEDKEARVARADLLLEGLSFSAPIAACAGDPQWFFPSPLTGADSGFTAPERELTLTIALASDSQLNFIDAAKPKGKVLTWDKLFKHFDFREKIEKVMKTWKITKDEHESGVCEIAAYLDRTCVDDPGGLDCRHAMEVKEFSNC